MSVVRVLFLFAFVQAAMAQSNLYCGRIIAHTPFYERILLTKGSFLRPATLRGVDDLKPGELFPGTNRIDRILSNTSMQRTNTLYRSCLPEVPIESLSLHCPGDLLDREQVRELLRDTVAVPRSAWTNHMSHSGGGRYVFSLGSGRQEFVIDERMGSCALVFYPDGTYQCLMDPGYWCLKRTKPDGAVDAAPPHR